ncbi:type II secretion system F family protein [Shewanella sp. NKUCC05_KAH]|jgi:MSHA biogenesis protein MshG|uniref:Type II secretion system F family protein n=1 Tax=Shewanella oncorhynchi TaxID=2726434 RepID=A0AA50KF63_9GAMM|nr:MULTISPECIES: type II secretion system F family protein [Shewanella]MBI1675310.1 type II secretion system F family protein [Shewanella sp. DW31]MBW3526670.1 type II secretion system F family protein [Shewanella sp. NKUCC05_KAH]MBW3530563.1 type II secretion system F family protein [Shewanella sp. NKUCC06_TVS]MCU7975086.1 type II secretion system F family protein [Shewanella sp. SW36]MCU7990475.1 type II secretion system F family protein [Shewanella sp. SW1]
MPIYQYRGRSGQGQSVTGQLDAASESAAADMLLARGIIPLEVKVAKVAKSFSLTKLFGGKVALEELQIFTRQMYSLTRSGIPILRAIAGLSETAHSQRMKDALNDISEQLTAGRPLSSSMNQHPDVFDSLFVSMVHVGENTGKLEDAFIQLSGYIEREQETRRRIKSAMRYPMFVLIAIALAMVILNIMVIPKFAEMFSRFGADLPWATKVLIGTSNLFVNYWALMLVALIGTIIGIRYWHHTEKGEKQWDKWKLHIPAVGSIIERSTLARYCRSFSMMLSAGVPMTQALSLVADAVDNAYMHDKIVGMRRGIESGDSMLRVSNQSKLFTPLVLQMVAVGEETGQIDQLLNDAADFYEGEVDYDLKNLTAKLEPILIGFVAVIVLVLALGIYLPMWDMLNVVKGGK